MTAWGADTVFLRACRPLEESIERLRARNWFAQREEALQHRLWQALEAFCARQPNLPIEYHRLRSDPAIAVACSPAPKGRARWTMKLLADKLVELEVVESIDPATVWRTLKKTTSSRGSSGGDSRLAVHHRRRTGEVKETLPNN